VNLIEELQAEVRRVRDEVIPAYRAIGAAGRFGLILLEHSAKQGEAAIAEMDTVGMVKALAELRGCE
jgi:hypothetical protein